MLSLANKYRPKEFNEVLAQKSIIKILEKQINTQNFSNVYLFCGPTGTGKTSLARIFADKINKGKGSPIEIDGASNNGVDNVRMLVESAKERSLDSEYKIFIVDECHSITSQGWQSFLKCLEETPKYTIFIFCTTNPEKVPSTIQNRALKFNLTKIKIEDIIKKLSYICEQEKYVNYDAGIEYIAKLSGGGVRDAIVALEKCALFSTDLSIINVLECLGTFTYDEFFKLTNAFIDGKETTVLNTIEKFYSEGKDLKQFIDQYLDFILDLVKYCLFKDIKNTRIPVIMEDSIKYTTGIENNIRYFTWLTDKILNIKLTIKHDTNYKTTVEALCLAICRGI